MEKVTFIHLEGIFEKLLAVMKRIFTLFAIFCLVLSSPAQRMLTPNPRFDIGSVPDSLGSALSASSVYLNTGYLHSSGTPDYFRFNPWVASVSTPSNQFGNQEDLSGDGYLGMMLGGTEGTEYVGIRLCEPTVVGNRYLVTVRASLAESSGYITKNFEINFAGTIIRPCQSGFHLNSTSQWQTFTDTITAMAATDEAYVGSLLSNIPLESFNPSGEPWCYVYLAEFSVVDLDQAVAICDTLDTPVSYSLVGRHNLLGQEVGNSFNGLTVETYKNSKGEFVAQTFLRK